MAARITKFKTFAEEEKYALQYWTSRGYKLPPRQTNPLYYTSTHAGSNDSMRLERLRLASEVARFHARERAAKHPASNRAGRVRLEWDEFTAPPTYRYELPCHHTLNFSQPLVPYEYSPADLYDDPEPEVVWCPRCSEEYTLNQVTDVTDPKNPRPVSGEIDVAKAFEAALAYDDAIWKTRISHTLFDLGRKAKSNPTGWTQKKAAGLVRAMQEVSDQYVEDELKWAAEKHARRREPEPEPERADKGRGPENRENLSLGKPRVGLVKEVMSAISNPFDETMHHEVEPYETVDAAGRVQTNPHHCKADEKCRRPVRTRGLCDMHRKRDERNRKAWARQGQRVASITPPASCEDAA